MSRKLFQTPKTKQKIRRGALFLFLLILGITMIIPFLWTLSSSFKFDREIFQYPIQWVPEVFRWSNYQEVWQRVPFLTYYLNTIKVSVIVTLGQVVTCSLAAYSFSKMEYPGRDKIFLCYLATMMVPWHAIMIPQFLVVKSLVHYSYQFIQCVRRVYAPSIHARNPKRIIGGRTN